MKTRRGAVLLVTGLIAVLIATVVVLNQPGGRSLLGGPESFEDMFTANSELAARDTAPFTSSAPGAYMAAYRQRLAMAAAAGPANSKPWVLAGAPPLCAAQTSSNVCPAAGPANGNYSRTGNEGFRTLSGRISSYAYDPTAQGHYFASPVVGGVWETSDGGATWHSIGDGLPTQIVGAIAYDAPLHRIIAGTGDNSFGGSGIAGHGVYYSDDDGATWHPAAGIPDLALSFKVVVSPADASGKTIYAALSKGLFRSDDGGSTFQNEELPTSPPGYLPDCKGDTTNNLCFFANDVTDVVVKSKATSNGSAGAVLAVVGWRAGQKVISDESGNPVKGCTQGGVATSCLQAPQNGLYESDTGDPGSFKYLPGGSGGVTGFAPTDVVGRTALAIAHGAGQNPDAVYALVQDAQKFNHCQDVLDNSTGVCQGDVQAVAVSTVLDGMYASYDFGKTWTKIMDWTQLRDPGTNSSIGNQAEYSPGIQGWYNLWVEADPTATDSSGDPARVLFGLEEVWENNPKIPSNALLTSPFAAFPGGTSATDPWVVIGRYWNACPVGPVAVSTSIGPCNPNPFTSGPLPGTTTHPDQHAYAMIPDGKGGVTLLVGSDGGAYKQHIDSSGTFSNDSWGDGLNKTISAVQPYDAEMAKDGTIVSGLQDNGEMKIAPDGHEAEIFDGDGFFTTIDPNDSKNIIEEYTYGKLSYSSDGGASWNGDTPTDCSSSNALFAAPIEQDPTMPGHVLVGCTQVAEATGAYTTTCVDPTCSLGNTPAYTDVFDLSTLPSPKDSSGNPAANIPSALAVRGANEYVAYCGFCDPASQQVPFQNGIATNVGGSAPPKIGAGDGWHQAKAMCSDCQTKNGLLPERYINGIAEDPRDPNTVYVVLGGYERRWIPPGSFGEDISNVGVGHLFVSHDHGEHFTNISGNLPDISANYVAFHNGQLLVATDLGVYIQDGGTADSPTFGVLGTGLPMAPVFTIRADPGDPNLFVVSTYGRGDWLYDFGAVNPLVGTITKGGPLCAKPSGRLHGARLGPFALGMRQTTVRGLGRLVNIQRYGFDDFCLFGGWGIRVGYPSRRLLRSLRPGLRAKVAGRAVEILTANPFYSLRGVRPGMRLSAVAKRLHLKPKRSFAVGSNRWYLIPGKVADGILKVRHGVIQEIGIGDRLLLTSRRADFRYFNGFPHG